MRSFKFVPLSAMRPVNAFLNSFLFESRSEIKDKKPSWKVFILHFVWSGIFSLQWTLIIKRCQRIIDTFFDTVREGLRKNCHQVYTKVQCVKICKCTGSGLQQLLRSSSLISGALLIIGFLFLISHICNFKVWPSRQPQFNWRQSESN